MSLRKFSYSVADVARDWYDNPIQNMPVRLEGPYSDTADGACRVSLSNGAIAYVKPKPGPENLLLVAREKIASDLAYLFELPVAPVLIRRPEGTAWPSHTAMSFSCFASPRPWNERHIAQYDDAQQALEGLRLFWTWIGDSDHGFHPMNLLYEVSSGTCRIMAIDHAYALCRHNGLNPLATGESQGYGTASLDSCAQVRSETARAIVADGMAHAQKVLGRLSGILTFGEVKTILNILEARLDLIKPYTG